MVRITTYQPILLMRRGKLKRTYAPFFDVEYLDCARHARYTAAVMFDKWFVPNDAWNRKFDDLTVVENVGSLDQLIREGILQPGMILGVNFPETTTNISDRAGEVPKYTHNSVYLGLGRALPAVAHIKIGANAQDKTVPLFSENFGMEERIMTLEDYRKYIGPKGTACPLTIVSVFEAKGVALPDDHKQLSDMHPYCRKGIIPPR